MVFYRAGLWSAVISIVFSGMVLAQDVTLTSRDGSVEIVGTLLGYDGEFYRVDSIYGELTLDGSGVLCSGPGCPDLNAFVAEIRLSGAQTIGNKLMPELINAFAEQQEYSVTNETGQNGHRNYILTEISTGQKAAIFDIQLSSSDEAFADLLAEETDVAMSLRAVSKGEIALGEEAGFGRFSQPSQNRVLALDALVPVVSPRNPVHAISPEMLASVFTGEVNNWEALGGIDAPIVLHLRKPGSGILSAFLKHIISPSGGTLEGGIERHDNHLALIGAIASDPFAIGLTTLSEQRGVKPLILTGGCGFRASAVPEALKSNDYPLTAPLFLYTRERRLPAIGREFMRFIGSPEAQIAILRAGFVDQAISRTPIARQGDRLANAIQAAGPEIQLKELQRLVSTMSNSRRLSVTFRFDDGASGMTAQSRSNVGLLARALESGVIGAQELLFVGFSDGEGAASANKRLSKERAESVRAAVLKEAATADHGRVKLRTDGFGEAMPMACDDTDWGRHTNRRVEVWAR